MERNIQCSDCKMSLTSKKSLDEHIKNIHEHICQHCPTRTSVISSEEDLKQDIEDEHTRSTIHNNNCEESFPGKNEVEIHVGEKHKFLCEHCEMVTTTNGDSEEHTISTHSFLCVTCNISFTTEKACSIHKKTVHSDTSTFECFSCKIVYNNKKQTQILAGILWCYEERVVAKLNSNFNFNFSLSFELSLAILSNITTTHLTTHPPNHPTVKVVKAPPLTVKISYLNLDCI